MANLDRRNFLMGAGTVASAAVLAGCGSTSGSASGSSAGSAGSSADKDKVVKGDPATSDAAQVTYEQGYLTVATGDPAWEPWVKNDDPASGEGFEAALIYAVADKMEFPRIPSCGPALRSTRPMRPATRTGI